MSFSLIGGTGKFADLPADTGTKKKKVFVAEEEIKVGNEIIKRRVFREEETSEVSSLPTQGDSLGPTIPI